MAVESPNDGFTDLCPCGWQCCIAGVLIGIPISIKRKSYAPFAVLGVLGMLRFTRFMASSMWMELTLMLCAMP